MVSTLKLSPTISLGSHQNIGLHTGTRANVVLLHLSRIKLSKMLKIPNRLTIENFNGLPLGCRQLVTSSNF